MQNPEPLVSFTFDDFPQSALLQGGGILRNYGFKGTFFASFGLMGRVAPTGKLFSYDDLGEFIRQEHEIGCHTFDHCDAWDTAPAEFEASVIRNRRAVREYLPGMECKVLSYPISSPRPETKRRAAKYFTCCRGGGQSFNKKTADFNRLNAFFIEQSRDNFNAIQQIIEDNVRETGWLIFATHDVADSPTRFGCTPAFFEKILRCATKSGAAILSISEAAKAVEKRDSLLS